MITDDEVGALLIHLSGRRATVVVDACHSGTSDRKSVVGEGWRYVKSPRRADGAPLQIGDVDEVQSAPTSIPEAYFLTKDPQLRAADVTIWAAVEAHQKALVDEELRGAPMSVFTRSLLSGMRDAETDGNGDGVVTRSELHEYLLRESEAYCERHASRCGRGLSPQLRGAAHAMDAPAFIPAVASLPALARTAKDILVGSASGTTVEPEDGVDLRIKQGTRLELGTEVEIVVTSPRDGLLVLLDIDASGDMVPHAWAVAYGEFVVVA